MSEATNPTTENASAEPQNLEGLDAAAEAFAKLNQAEQSTQHQPEEEAEPEDGAEEEADTEADEADPEADESTEHAVEVEYEGKTYKVAPELQKALLRQSDYSRAMNEVKGLEKQYAERLQAVESIGQGTEEYAKALAEVNMIEAQLQQVQGIDWDALEANNPAEASRLAVRQLRLQQQLNQALDKAKSTTEKVSEERAKLLSSRRAEMFKTLEKSIKGWGDELGQKLTEYAVKSGVSYETLAQTTDPGVVIALEKARKYDELQASKPALKAKAQAAPPVTKPGAPRKTDSRTEAMQRHRNDGSIDSAAAAFLAIGR